MQHGDSASVAGSQYSYERFVQEENKRIFSENQNAVTQLAEQRFLEALEREANSEEQYVKNQEDQIQDSR